MGRMSTHRTKPDLGSVCVVRNPTSAFWGSFSSSFQDHKIGLRNSIKAVSWQAGPIANSACKLDMLPNERAHGDETLPVLIKLRN